MSDALSKYERQTLAEMFLYKGRPYYWRKASVAKLVKRGFAESYPGAPNAFRLTEAALVAYEGMQ